MWLVKAYGVWYCSAPSLAVDSAGFSRLTLNVEGMVLRGLVLFCFGPSLDTAAFSRLTLKMEGMGLRGPVLLRLFPHT